jgi:hypothetical protein
MPVYEEEGTLTRDDLQQLRRSNNCLECGGQLNVFYDLDAHMTFVACADWPRSHHEGITREPSRYEKGGLSELNIETRRQIMTQELGTEKTTALEKYSHTAVASPMTKAIATEIVNTLWGDAPLIEKQKCILLCQTYQLNPLMKHLYLVGYKRNVNGKPATDANGKLIMDWSIQIGIGATRLMAQRRHNYSYLDFTPRKASKEEVEKILGDTADPGSIYGFVHIRDQDSGAEAFGLRGIKLSDNIKGTEKGNTHLNQACVRAERLALDRQYPGEMPPPNLEVFDERFIEPEYRVVDRGTGEILDEGQADAEPLIEETDNGQVHWCAEHNCAFTLKNGRYGAFWAHKKDGGGWCNEKKANSKKEEAPEPTPESSEPPASLIDMDWLADSLKKLEATGLKAWNPTAVLDYMKVTYKVEGASIVEMAGNLDKGAAAHFVQRIQDTLEMA